MLAPYELLRDSDSLIVTISPRNSSSDRLLFESVFRLDRRNRVKRDHM